MLVHVWGTGGLKEGREATVQGPAFLVAKSGSITKTKNKNWKEENFKQKK